MTSATEDFRAHLETIESAYEYMLAYAAQGRDSDAGAAAGPSIRDTLDGLHAALGAVAGTLEAATEEDRVRGLARTIAADADKASISVAAALSCSRISSQLIDNLNASIHLRAVLTGLFLADEIVQISNA